MSDTSLQRIPLFTGPASELAWAVSEKGGRQDHDEGIFVGSDHIAFQQCICG